MSIIRLMEATKTADPRYVEGACAQCQKPVFEALWILDDAYNVWVGQCPHCNAHNLLGTDSLRGYSSTGMSLVLPTAEELELNNWPRDWPVREAKPGGTIIHGSMAGELHHILGGSGQ